MRPSAVYLQQILRTCQQVGVEGRLVEIGSEVTPETLCTQIERLNADQSVAGIIVQMPLPADIPLRTVIDSIDPAKDIDGIHPRNAGLLSLGYDGFLPATAQASVEILKRSGIEIAGKRVVVIGRSNVVGKPAALLLLREHGTVSVLHSRTRDLGHYTRDAEILIVAAGKPGLVTGDMLSPGVVVVDVGINVVSDGAGGEKLVGDVDFESARDVVSAITPVPGGVGPLTNALLLTHLLRAATDQAERSPGRAPRGFRHHERPQGHAQQPGDCPLGHPAADHRTRPRAGSARRRSRAVRAIQGQGPPRGDRTRWRPSRPPREDAGSTSS